MSGALPEQCCSILPSTGELIVIKRGERGYYRSEWNTDSREENKNIADFTNSRMGITPAQLEAMICGSMCGWDVPGAQPQFYLDRASKEKSVAITGHIKHPVLSTYFPVKGNLHTYRIMGADAYYIDFSSMPKMMMEERLCYTYHPNLVTGELMPLCEVHCLIQPLLERWPGAISGIRFVCRCKPMTERECAFLKAPLTLSPI